MSSRPITDFIDDRNLKFILERWFRVVSEVADLKDWEPLLVSDAQRIFG